MVQQLRDLFKDNREVFDLNTLDDPAARNDRLSPVETVSLATACDQVRAHRPSTAQHVNANANEQCDKSGFFFIISAGSR